MIRNVLIVFCVAVVVFLTMHKPVDAAHDLQCWNLAEEDFNAEHGGQVGAQQVLNVAHAAFGRESVLCRMNGHANVLYVQGAAGFRVTKDTPTKSGRSCRKAVK